MANKVKFGLSNVKISKISYGDNNSITYGTPFDLKGAVNLSLDGAGESADFYADNTKYFSDSTNQGYTGTLEVALINEKFRTDILGQYKDVNGALIENAVVLSSVASILTITFWSVILGVIVIFNVSVTGVLEVSIVWLLTLGLETLQV